MTSIRSIAIALLGASLAGCAGGTIGGPKEETGTLVGAGAGALLGNRIGAAMDDEDKKRA